MNYINMTFTILLSCVLIMSSFSISAQKKNTGIITYEPFESETEDNNTNEIMYRTCIKWNYSLLPRGVLLFNAEQVTGNYLSIEAGAGLTYRDYIFEMSLYDFYYTDFSEETNIGYAVEGGLRIYPSGSDDLYGFYINPAISYRSYSITSIYSVSKTYDLGYEFLDIQFKIGYQDEGWMWDVYYDYYFGVGYRKAAYWELVENGNNLPEKVQMQREIPQLLMGIKIGVPF